MRTCLTQNKLLLFNFIYKTVIRNLYEAKNNVVNEKSLIASINYNTKLIKTAIIGVPNAGKSTLVNVLSDRKVCPVSNKVHTTRKCNHSIVTEGDTQIVFLDTPGIVSATEQKKYNLEKSFIHDCTRSLYEADVIGVIHDVSNTWTRDRLDIKLIHLLEQHSAKPSFLVLNKIDALKSKRKLLDVTRLLTEGCINSIPYGISSKKRSQFVNRGWSNFSEVFMVSALECDGVQGIKEYLVKNARPGEWMYPAEQWTDHMPDDIILRTVQATLLDFLPQEIPYKLKCEMELFETQENGEIIAVVLVHCPSERIQKLVVGIGDGKLRQITEKAQKDLLQTFDQSVRLRIVVRNK